MNQEVENKEKISFPVLGMSCAACAVSVEGILESVSGVSRAQVNFATHSASVEYDPSLAGTQSLKSAMRSGGYDIIVDQEDSLGMQEQLQLKSYLALKRRTLWSLALASPVFLIGMFFMDMPFADWISMAFTIPVLFYFGRHFFIGAYRQGLHGKANMDTLVALSTGVAFLFSAFNTIYPDFWHHRGLHAHVYYEAAAVIIAFISLGKLLEETAKGNTSSAVKKLIGLQPSTVTLFRDGQEFKAMIAEVQIDDILVVKPGERVAVDGVISSGISYVDQSMITGEPLPVLKQQGDLVYAGTINQKGSFNMTAKKVGGDTLLSGIIRMVQLAQGSKAPVQRLVDRIAGIFVPMVILISVSTFALWILLGGEGAFTHAVLSAITVLVIACPCALGLATPTAIMVGVGKGAEENILIKDAQSLETAHLVDVVVLDKTGTVTMGRPVVNHLFWNVEVGVQSQARSILLAMEQRSEHPLATAVVDKIADGIMPAMINDFQSVTGRGVSASFNGKTYYIGNQGLMLDNGILLPAHIIHMSNGLKDHGHAVIYFADDRTVLAVMGLKDTLKATSRSAIADLQQMGITVYLLTGDNPETAAHVAREVGIEHYQGDVLPAGKEAFVKALQQQGATVAMVGDGINDSQALAQADISIAMANGSDIAIDVAKITLVSSDLSAIAKALKLSKRTINTIRQNLFWAFIYNLIGIPLAAGVLYAFNGFLLNPMIAGAAMALSSVSVVTNSLRLKRARL